MSSTVTMPIVLADLDTVSDFSAYLDAKVLAVAKLDYLSYCGEEDLLAHYLLNYDQASQRHVIGLKHEENVNDVLIGEGEWHDFVKTDVYKNTEKEDRISYFWDALIQRTWQDSLNGTLGGNSNILRGESAIYEMVREPRFFRRSLSSKMLSAVERFPDHPSGVHPPSHLSSVLYTERWVHFRRYSKLLVAQQRTILLT